MKERIIYGVIAGILFITMLALGGYWFTSLITVMAVLGYREFIRLNQLPLVNIQAIVGYAIVVYLVFPWSKLFPEITPNFSVITWLYLLFLLICMVITKNKLHLEHAAIYFLAFGYISFGFKFMVDTIWLPDQHGQFWALLIFASIWATDSGAYFTGVFLGKRPLLPAISPKKTIEGSLGGVVFAMLSGFIFAYFKPELLSYSQAIWLTLSISILAQFGDLIQSAYKRHRNIKDSGTLIPGHGGILDRTDSWIIVFPFVHLIFVNIGWIGG